MRSAIGDRRSAAARKRCGKLCAVVRIVECTPLAPRSGRGGSSRPCRRSRESAEVVALGADAWVELPDRTKKHSSTAPFRSAVLTNVAEGERSMSIRHASNPSACGNEMRMMPGHRRINRRVASRCRV